MTISSSLSTFFPTRLITLPSPLPYSKLFFQNYLRIWRHFVMQQGGKKKKRWKNKFTEKGSCGVWRLRTTSSGWMNDSDQELEWKRGALLCVSHSKGPCMGLFDFGRMMLLPGLREESQAALSAHLNHWAVLKGGQTQQRCRGTVSIRY